MNGYELTPSYAQIIRDVLFARTVIIPFFDGFIARRTKQFPVAPELLPYLGVYFVRDRHNADGDWNHGSVDFIHELTIGFSVIMQDNDPVRLENKLHHAYRLLFENLWPDQYMMNLLHTYNPHTGTENPENVRIEGVKRGGMDINWGSIGKNETPLAELQYEPVLVLRSIWPPFISDDLLKIHVETVPMVGPRGDRHPPPEDEVKRIITKYEFNPTSEE